MTVAGPYASAGQMSLPSATVGVLTPSDLLPVPPPGLQWADLGDGRFALLPAE